MRADVQELHPGATEADKRVQFSALLRIMVEDGKMIPAGRMTSYGPIGKELDLGLAATSMDDAVQKIVPGFAGMSCPVPERARRYFPEEIFHGFEG